MAVVILKANSRGCLGVLRSMSNNSCGALETILTELRFDARPVPKAEPGGPAYVFFCGDGRRIGVDEEADNSAGRRCCICRVPLSAKRFDAPPSFNPKIFLPSRLRLSINCGGIEISCLATK